MNGELIKRRLFELRLSKEEFAVKMGCSIATVYNMLASKKVSEENIFRATEVLGIDLSKLTAKRRQNA